MYSWRTVGIARNLGHFRDIRVVGHQARITATLERSKCPPWGLEGGEPGMTNVLVVNPGTAAEKARAEQGQPAPTTVTP